MIKKNYFSFTFIEVLIVISVIGTLSAISYSTFQSTRLKSRDVVRKRDVHSVGLALSLYRKDNNRYPLDNNSGSMYGFCTSDAITYPNASSYWTTLETSLSPYMPSLPLDPIAKCGRNTLAYHSGPGYENFLRAYSYDTREFQLSYTPRYSFWAALENKNDPERSGNGNFQSLLDYSLFVSGATSEWGNYVYGVGCTISDTSAQTSSPCYSN